MPIASYKLPVASSLSPSMDSFSIWCMSQIKETFTAKWFISPFFTQDNQFFSIRKTVTKLGKISATHANGMYFRDIFGACHSSRDRTERLTSEIHVKACD